MNREEALAQALADALDGMQDMIAYVPDYFRQKWEHDAYIARASSVLETMSYQPVSYDSPEWQDTVKPSVGRTVHYVSYGTPGGEYQSECRAAVVTQVHGGEIAAEEQQVSLCVLNPTGVFFNDHVAHSDAPKGGSWHWPEREV